MKILLLNNEIWNDQVSGNNIFQNWFNDMDDVEIRVICTDPGKPFNKVCNHYFQVTDAMMARSIIGKRAGIKFELSYEEMAKNPQTKSYAQTSPFYSFMKRISGTSIRLIREFIWTIGRYNEDLLKEYIEDFNPDIIFSPRLYTWKTARLERIIRKYTDAPIVTFAGDDEVSFKQISYNPLYWINRYFLNKSFKKQLPLYAHYFTNSDLHASEYRTKYKISASSLYKSGAFKSEFLNKKIYEPIRLVYAGRLYCNRWKSLAEIGKALKIINKDKERMILEVYSQEVLNKKQRKHLSEENHIYFKGMVSPESLPKIYENSDIALHVESLDKKNRLKTRLSFSTKIIDLMASNCAIMVIAWDQHAGFKYIKENEVGICISSYEQILPILQNVCDDSDMITRYALQAYECGINNHSKSLIQNQIKSTFQNIIEKGNK